jgi:hypothetical protein
VHRAVPLSSRLHDKEIVMNAKHAVFSLTIAFTALAALPAAADNACKDLRQQACADNAGCGWVKGYTRKDGREVAPYCRAKATSKTSSNAADLPVPPAS